MVSKAVSLFALDVSERRGFSCFKSSEGATRSSSSSRRWFFLFMNKKGFEIAREVKSQTSYDSDDSSGRSGELRRKEKEMKRKRGNSWAVQWMEFVCNCGFSCCSWFNYSERESRKSSRWLVLFHRTFLFPCLLFVETRDSRRVTLVNNTFLWHKGSVNSRIKDIHDFIAMTLLVHWKETGRVEQWMREEGRKIR